MTNGFERHPWYLSTASEDLMAEIQGTVTRAVSKYVRDILSNLDSFDRSMIYDTIIKPEVSVKGHAHIGVDEQEEVYIYFDPFEDWEAPGEGWHIPLSEMIVDACDLAGYSDQVLMVKALREGADKLEKRHKQR